MPSRGLSKNSSFYQIACHTTDTFTSCIRTYEALLPHFEAERPDDDDDDGDDSVIRRLLNIGGILTALYNELATLRNDIITDIVSHDNNHKLSELSAESKGPTKVANEQNQQENISCDAITVEQEETQSEKGLNKLSKTNWEEVGQALGEECQRENVNHEVKKMEKIVKVSHKDMMMEEPMKVSHEEKKMEKTVKVNHEVKKMGKTMSHDQKVLIKPNKGTKKHASNFGYFDAICNEIARMHNQEFDLRVSFALHNQDGCCSRYLSKLVAVQKERTEKHINRVSVQGQLQNQTT